MSISVINCPRKVQVGDHECELCDSGTMPVDVVETFLGFLVMNERMGWTKLTEIFEAETGLVLDVNADREFVDRCVEEYKARFRAPEVPDGALGPKPAWAS